jgi:hypothetical protein
MFDSYLGTAALGTDIRVYVSLFTASGNFSIAYLAAMSSFRTLLSADCRVFVLNAISVYTDAALIAARDIGILDHPMVGQFHGEGPTSLYSTCTAELGAVMVTHVHVRC